jgi:ElaA protein
MQKNVMEFILRHFKDLTIDQLYDLLRLRAEVFVVEQKCNYLDLDGKDKVGLHFMGYENGALLAYARLLPKGISYDNYSSIGRVIVQEEARGKQLGYELMNKANSETIKSFGHPIKISAQAHLEEFYTSVGYVTQAGNVYFEDEIPHIGMILSEPNAFGH